MKFFDFPESELDFFSDARNLEGEQLSLETLDRSGVFVVRNLVSPECANSYLKKYEEGLSDGSARPRQNHITEVSFDIDSPLANILFEPEVSAAAALAFKDGAGLHNIRVIRKDQSNTEPVFVHQDSPYCLGFFDRFSMFLALSPCGPENGGLFFYPGTHHFGYLGDAGAIRTELTDKLYKFTPSLAPGDCLLMHSAIWHGSSRHDSAVPRVLYDIQIQPVIDPSSVISLCDQPLSKWRLRLDNQDIFSSSRMQRGASAPK